MIIEGNFSLYIPILELKYKIEIECLGHLSFNKNTKPTLSGRLF